MQLSLPVLGVPESHITRAEFVCFVRPAVISAAHAWAAPFAPPIGLAYVAAAVRERGHQVQVVDAAAEGLDHVLVHDGYRYQGLALDEIVKRIDPQTRVIGVSCMFSIEWPWTRQLIQRLRDAFPQAAIVAGGEHLTALPEFCLRDCPGLDYCVLGEGEETMAALVDCLARGDDPRTVDGIGLLDPSGAYRQTAPRRRIREVNQMPRPAWDLFPVRQYLANRNGHGVYRGRSLPVLGTRGCPYKCTFCSNPTMYGNLWVAREPGDVLDEIADLQRDYGIENVDFYDLTFVLRRRWILEFCAEIERRGMRFTWQLPSGTRSEVIDSEVSAALYRTGCRNLTYAPESGSLRTLERIKKQVDPQKLIASIRQSVAQGIRVKCTAIIGFPDETRRDVWQTIRFIWRLALAGVEDMPIFFFSPYPGSTLFAELRQEGVIAQLDDAYFRSLMAFLNPFASSRYCRNLTPRELQFWRNFGLVSFYGLALMRRPWRIARVLRNVLGNRAETATEQRLAVLLRRGRAQQRGFADAIAKPLVPRQHRDLRIHARVAAAAPQLLSPNQAQVASLDGPSGPSTETRERISSSG